MKNLLMHMLGRLPIGWLQLLHNRARLIAAVGGVAFANVLIFMQLGFMYALFETSVLTTKRFAADVIIASDDFHSLREANLIPRSRMFQALSVPEVDDAVPVYTATMNWTNPQNGDTTNFRVMGVDPDQWVFLDADLQDQLPVLRQESSALLDRKMREFPEALQKQFDAEGSLEMEAQGRRLTVLGLFEQGASFDVDGILVVSDQTFFRLFPRRGPGVPSLILLRCRPGADFQAVAQAVNDRMPERDARAFTKENLMGVEQRYQAQQTPIGFVFGFGVAIGLVVGVVIVYQVLSTDVQDHLSEYATLKAVGYSPRYFLGIVFEEALCLSALGFVPGLTIALVLYEVASRATALPISMPWTRPVVVFLLTAVMCSLSGAIATRRLNSADPADLF